MKFDVRVATYTHRPIGMLRGDAASTALVSFISISVTLASLYFLFRPEMESEKPKEAQPPKTPTEGGLGLSDEEKEMFIPSVEWKTVKDNHVCPAGLEYRLNLTDGTKLARILQ